MTDKEIIEQLEKEWLYSNSDKLNILIEFTGRIDIIFTVDNKEQLVTINRNELNFEPKEYQQVIARVKQIGEKRI
jgi:hypothetical protein